MRTAPGTLAPGRPALLLLALLLLLAPATVAGPPPVGQLNLPVDPLRITYADGQKVRYASSLVTADLRLGGSQSWEEEYKSYTVTADIKARLALREDQETETRTQSLEGTLVQVERYKRSGDTNTTTIVYSGGGTDTFPRLAAGRLGTLLVSPKRKLCTFDLMSPGKWMVEKDSKSPFLMTTTVVVKDSQGTRTLPGNPEPFHLDVRLPHQCTQARGLEKSGRDPFGLPLSQGGKVEAPWVGGTTSGSYTTPVRGQGLSLGVWTGVVDTAAVLGARAAGDPSDQHDLDGSLTVTWSVNGTDKPQPLEAVVNVPTSVERGATVTLDGSRSRGRIRESRWTFQPAGGAGNPKAEKTGAQAETVLLDATRVTLTVSDGQKTDSRTVLVKVVPRQDFRTPFETAGEGPMPDSKPPTCRVVGQTGQPPEPVYEAGWTGGENVCDLDPDAAPHVFHPNPAEAGRDDLFTLIQVRDPGGPFDGCFYFQDWKVEIRRRILVNSYLLENAPPPFRHMAVNFYQANLAAGKDVAGYLAAVRQHEQEHSDRIRQALPGLDPARETEKAYGTDETKLRDEAEIRILDAAVQLHQKARDPLPETWQGDLLATQVDTDQWRSFRMHVGGKYSANF